MSFQNMNWVTKLDDDNSSLDDDLLMIVLAKNYANL